MIMDSAATIDDKTATGLLNRALEALLSDGSLQHRLCDADAYIRQLERYGSEAPGELTELKRIVSTLQAGDMPMDGSDTYLVQNRELELAEQLLELYVCGNGGALIF
jgi:hypothetical protein